MLYSFKLFGRKTTGRYLCRPLKENAALVKGLRRLPFTEESRVRIPYVVQKLFIFLKGFFYWGLLPFVMLLNICSGYSLQASLCLLFTSIRQPLGKISLFNFSLNFITAYYNKNLALLKGSC